MKISLASIATASVLAACGSKKSDDPAPLTGYALVSSIVSANCATSGCHANKANMTTCGDFTASEAGYKAAQACTTTANTPAARLQLTSGDKKMPVGKDLSAADKETLVNFK